jgi:Glycosyl transferase family 90
MYLESGAWATNFKQKLACGSVLLAVAPTHFEFFSRALVPGLHYVAVPAPAAGASELAYPRMCADIARQVRLWRCGVQDSG